MRRSEDQTRITFTIPSYVKSIGYVRYFGILTTRETSVTYMDTIGRKKLPGENCCQKSLVHTKLSLDVSQKTHPTPIEIGIWDFLNSGTKVRNRTPFIPPSSTKIEISFFLYSGTNFSENPQDSPILPSPTHPPLPHLPLKLGFRVFLDSGTKFRKPAHPIQTPHLTTPHGHWDLGVLSSGAKVRRDHHYGQDFVGYF